MQGKFVKFKDGPRTDTRRRRRWTLGGLVGVFVPYQASKLLGSHGPRDGGFEDCREESCYGRKNAQQKAIKEEFHGGGVTFEEAAWDWGGFYEHFYTRPFVGWGPVPERKSRRRVRDILLALPKKSPTELATVLEACQFEARSEATLAPRSSRRRGIFTDPIRVSCSWMGDGGYFR